MVQQLLPVGCCCVEVARAPLGYSQSANGAWFRFAGSQTDRHGTSISPERAFAVSSPLIDVAERKRLARVFRPLRPLFHQLKDAAGQHRQRQQVSSVVLEYA